MFTLNFKILGADFMTFRYQVSLLSIHTKHLCYSDVVCSRAS